MERLHNSGLPFYDFILINGQEFESNIYRIKKFAEKHKQMWTRIIGLKGRYYKLDIKGLEELMNFIKSLNIDIKEFQIQLFEYHDNIFGGNIITNNNGVYIELAKGTQERVSKNFLEELMIYFGKINKNGRLVFFQEQVPNKIKIIANKVLKYLKVERTKYIEGYFEFVVSAEDQIFFLDYKTSIV